MTREFSLKMFGDPVTVTVELTDDGRIIDVMPLRANEDCTRLIRFVSAGFAKDRPLIKQWHSGVALGDLVRALLAIEEDAITAAKKVAA